MKHEIEALTEICNLCTDFVARNPETSEFPEHIEHLRAIIFEHVHEVDANVIDNFTCLLQAFNRVEDAKSYEAFLKQYFGFLEKACRAVDSMESN